MGAKPYRDYADFLADYFPGKMQKLSVNVGHNCPNRDGTIGRGGCTYCNNRSFSPGYTLEAGSVTAQIEEGKRFFARKYPSMRYLAYFQSYTSTHGEIGEIIAMVDEALSVDGVDGLIVATRPDCMPDRLLSALRERAQHKWVMVEYGAESSHDSTLCAVNRCHRWADTVDAVERTAGAGLPVGLHLIMGLPGEDREMMLSTIDAVNRLPVSVVKFHQLQVLRGTLLARQIDEGLVEVHRFTVDGYIALCCDIVKRLRSDIAIERFVSQSPDELLISPRWGLKNHEFTDRLRNTLLRSM